MATVIDTELKKKRYTATEAKKRGLSNKLIAKYWAKKRENQ